MPHIIDHVVNAFLRLLSPSAGFLAETHLEAVSDSLAQPDWTAALTTFLLRPAYPKPEDPRKQPDQNQTWNQSDP